MNDRLLVTHSRRAPFATLAMAGLTALSSSVTASARKQSNNKKARKRCRTQIGQCETLAKTVTPDCEDDPVCAVLLACCEFAGRCDFAGFMECATALNA